MLYQIAKHDGMLPAGQADKAIARTSRAEVHHYRMDHFGPFSPEHHLTVAADASDFLRSVHDARLQAVRNGRSGTADATCRSLLKPEA